MKEIWLVGRGEYSDGYTTAACSSEEQANGVAVVVGGYVDGSVQLWEPEDGVPPHKPLYKCTVRNGPDSHEPLDIWVEADPIAVEAQPEPERVVIGPGPNPPRNFRWARAENYRDPDKAKRDALAAYVAMAERLGYGPS